jgi:hypothetical protein
VETHPYCPTFVWLRMALVQIDVAMRFMHLGIYGLVLLGRYVDIIRKPDPSFSCANLVSFFAKPQ